MSTFLLFLQQITAEYDSRIYKIGNNLETVKPRNKLYQKLDAQINDVLTEYEVKNLMLTNSLSRFLRTGSITICLQKMNLLREQNTI